MSISDLVHVTEALSEIAESAGTVVMSQFQRGGLDVAYKKDSSPVTSADLLSEAHILRQLNDRFPEIPVVSEEQSVEQNRSAMAERFFLVDPLDSTKNYMNGLPAFDVSIALVCEGKSTVGIIHDPLHRVTYSAGRGMGAFANNNPIQCRECQSIESADLDLNVPRLDQSLYEMIMLDLARRAKKVRYFGSAVLEMCWIASGCLDALINHSLSNWDVAAATLLLEEAGGTWGDLSGAIYAMDSLERRPIVAAGDARLMNQILSFLEYSDD